MHPFGRSPHSPSCAPQPTFLPPASSTSRPDAPRVQIPTSQGLVDEQGNVNVSAMMKGPKRKRLAKACDACHKSKRRCDGTAPCSNCYFASKTCTYTDATGRSVPAPRPFHPDGANPPAEPREVYHAHPLDRFNPNRRLPDDGPSGYNVSSASRPALNSPEEEHTRSRKRFRPDAGSASTDLSVMDPGPSNVIPTERPSGLDHALTRELVNLFFTHCHPQRLIIHKPSFSAALSHNRVPSYLVHAVCALAAPLSKQPRIRTTPSRLAGRYFAQEALTIMFDSSGRLVCERNLATAQALCLLQSHEFVSKPNWSTRYHDFALQILDSLEIHKPDNPTLTPVPSPEFIEASIERECVRRIFWLIHVVDLTFCIYLKRLIPQKDNELLLRLPVDETSFELAVHSTLPEYLYLPAPRTQYASEFGHLIRVLSIYSKVEVILDALNGSDNASNATSPLMESEQALDSWAMSLPDHLRFSEESLQVQLSMFETSSNAGAWCFSFMHTIHASCSLALNVARQRAQRGLVLGPLWAVGRLEKLLTSLGGRARNSVIMGAALWSLFKYCNRDDQQVRTWSAEYEDAWGFQVQALASVDWCKHLPETPTRFSHSILSMPMATPVDRNGHDPLTGRPGSSLGRSLNELRLHTASGGGGGNDTDSRRLVSDDDIDPALQSARSAGVDSPQSLPSLKACGLLDSWNPAKECPPKQAAAGAASSLSSSSSSSTWTTRPESRQKRLSPPRRKSPLLPASQTPDSEALRSSTGAPVGLPWLANEAR